MHANMGKGIMGTMSVDCGYGAMVMCVYVAMSGYACLCVIPSTPATLSLSLPPSLPLSPLPLSHTCVCAPPHIDTGPAPAPAQDLRLWILQSGCSVCSQEPGVCIHVCMDLSDALSAAKSQVCAYMRVCIRMYVCVWRGGANVLPVAKSQVCVCVCVMCDV